MKNNKMAPNIIREEKMDGTCDRTEMHTKFDQII
jgi:hypothetical protein